MPVRGARIELSVRRARRGEEPGFRIGPRRVPYHLYGVSIEVPEKGGRVPVRAVIP